MGWIGVRDERFRERFRQVLLAVPTQDLATGWSLASDLGRPAAPLLWEMTAAESASVGPRLVVMAAAIFAGGPLEDERLFAWLERPKPMLEERVLVSMLLALGPKRTRTKNEFRSRVIGPNRSPEQILGIAARLASARFAGQDAGTPVLLDDDPGLAAAAIYAGNDVPASTENRLWNLRAPERHAELFWRAAMLGGARQIAEHGAVSDALLGRARDLMALPGDQFAAVRSAAAIFRSRARDLRAEGPCPDWRLVQAMAIDAAGAHALADWLGAAAQPRDEEPQRLAVAYVLSREAERVVAERGTWGTDPRIARHVAIALAWRLLGDASTRAIDVQMPATPEWAFVRWATGASIDAPGQIEDPQLQTALGLAVTGRIDRDALRTALEDALWRWGSHPAQAVVEQERLLVRDLLLVGSNLGGGKYVPHIVTEQRYRPTGIGPDATFFRIAVAAYDFLARPRGPVPAEHRLR